MPIKHPFHLARAAQRLFYANTHFGYPHKQRLAELMSEGDGRRHRITERHITHREDVLAMVPNAILRVTISKFVVVLLMVEQHRVLTDAYDDSDILIGITLRLNHQRDSTLTHSCQRGDGVVQRISLCPSLLCNRDKSEMPRISHAAT